MTNSASPTDEPETTEELPPLVEEGPADGADEGNGPDGTPLLPDPGSPGI